MTADRSHPRLEKYRSVMGADIAQAVQCTLYVLYVVDAVAST